MTPTIEGLTSARQLNQLLEGMVRAGVLDMRRLRLPPLYRSSIRYKREAMQGGSRLERWRLPKRVAQVGSGDCEDLAIYRAAELRARGIDPNARAIVKRIRPGLLHAIVRRGNGRIEDPSKRLGMQGRG